MKTKPLSARRSEWTKKRAGLGALGVASTVIALSGIAGIDCGGTTLTLAPSESDASSGDAPYAFEDSAPPPDNEAGPDSGPPSDAGQDATVPSDSGPPCDAGQDATVPSDSGTPTDASLADASDATPLDDAADAAKDAADASAGQDAADGALPPWTPAAIGSRLAFWFDPTSLVQVGGNVAKWSDLSGNGNDALQATGEYEPAYNPSGIGGLPSATFNGPITFLSIADGPTMQWATSDFIVFAVARATAQSAVNAMLYQKTGVSPYNGASLYLNAGKPVGTTLAAAQVSGAVYVVSDPPPSTFVDSSVHLLGAYRAGATLEVRVDGVVSNSITSASVATTDVSSVGWSGIIGQNGYGIPQAEFQQVHGDIAEMVGVHGTLTQTELARLEQYLMSRYAIP